MINAPTTRDQGFETALIAINVSSGMNGMNSLLKSLVLRKLLPLRRTSQQRLEIFDACAALGDTCNWVDDFNDAIRYYKRAKEGYKEQLGRDSEEALDATRVLIMSTAMSVDERTEKLRDLLKRMERALGEENVVTLNTLDQLGIKLNKKGEDEEAKECMERSLAGRMKVLGEDHKDTLAKLNNLGIVNKKEVEELREGVGVLRESFEREREVNGDESSEYNRDSDEYRDWLQGVEGLWES
ncbi:hypothetical protein TL16_g08655 [Triparma laevis f. inornata]|uniref:Uncharacterized protein n=1 Tax=Triparma laevis f. inornata TaxID=1714386 RepID=A0A9W7AXC3_9STRA|nr:hypothetical protein TL16_g08655 [Triparma laevis f. inornata]